MALAIVHHLTIPDPKNHFVHVETRISNDEGLPDPLVLFMPVWTPGSYLMREYSRNVESLTAEPPAKATKVRKNAWRFAIGGGATCLVVRYRVYANELTVRTSHVDETHAFLVGATLFLTVEGAADTGASIEIDAPRGWHIATSLPVVPLDGAGRYRLQAADFDTLVDSPIELGTHREELFRAADTPHRYSIWPATAISDADVQRLVKDTTAIVEFEASLFGGTVPYDRYDLLLHLSPRGRGGLEHGSSAALVASPAAFATRDSYLDLLSLVAHECFHVWNIKRIRPAGLEPYRYEQECYTRLLWWFEGGTSYYDWRVLARSQLCTVEEYLDHLSAELSYLERTPGRLVHALEDASFDAWIKLYRPDENSSNSSVSYYRKGEVVCALLDLELRARTAGRATLDLVLAHLWNEYGAKKRAVPEDSMQEIFEQVSGVKLGDLFDAWIRSPAEIDVQAVLARVGLATDRSVRPDGAPCSLGVRIQGDGARAMVAGVVRGTAASRAGIDPGDEILAVAGARIDGTRLEAGLSRFSPGETVEVLVARDGRLVTTRATLDPPTPDRVKIVARADAPPAARAAFAAWLGRPHPAWADTAPRQAAAPDRATPERSP